MPKVILTAHDDGDIVKCKFVRLLDNGWVKAGFDGDVSRDEYFPPNEVVKVVDDANDDNVLLGDGNGPKRVRVEP